MALIFWPFAIKESCIKPHVAWQGHGILPAVFSNCEMPAPPAPCLPLVSIQIQRTASALTLHKCTMARTALDACQTGIRRTALLYRNAVASLGSAAGWLASARARWSVWEPRHGPRARARVYAPATCARARRRARRRSSGIVTSASPASCGLGPASGAEAGPPASALRARCAGCVLPEGAGGPA